jgi:hypothetical protein
MIDKTFELRKKMMMLDTSQERLRVFENAYEGDTAYIVAAGPSINNYEKGYLKEFLSDKLTFCIKQSYDMLEDSADVHIQNFCNFKQYNYSGNEKTITTWLVFDPNHPPTIINNNIKCDMMLPIYRNNGKMEETIAEAGDFESMLIQKSFARPWGPGCMYELAIPLAIYSGCKKIVTVGWDIGDLEKTKENKSMFQDHFYGGEDTVEFGITETSHREITSVSDSTKGLFYFLKDLGIDWEMSSDRNPGYEGIRRIKL